MASKESGEQRRQLLAACVSGAVFAQLGSALAGAQRAAASQAPAVRIVNDFCAAVSKRDPNAVRAFFANDIVYRMDEKTPPFVGVEAVMGTFQKFVGDATSVDFEILETYTSGPIVMNRRIDRFALKKPLVIEVVGVFFISDGKIKEWSDYTIRVG